MTVGLIWAQSTSGVIGRDGGIPWRLPEDQARFKELTHGPHRGDGPADLGVAAREGAAAARPQKCRSDPAS